MVKGILILTLDVSWIEIFVALDAMIALPCLLVATVLIGKFICDIQAMIQSRARGDRRGSSRHFRSETCEAQS